MSNKPGGNSSIQVGSIKVTGLTDILAPFPMPLNQLFPTVSAEAWPAIQQLYPNTFSDPNTWAIRVSCYLIRLPGQTLLVDAGIGPASSGPAQQVGRGGELLERLQQEGIAPGEIDTVLFTHLHPDHVGWAVQYEAGQARPTFPKARYFAPQADWEMGEGLLATNPEYAAHLSESVLPLHQWGCLSLIAGEVNLAEGVKVVPTPGHTPGHMSVRIESGSEPGLLLLGDAIAHPLQINEPGYPYALDGDAQIAAETRGRLLEQIVAEKLIIAACHFPEPGFGRVIQEGDERYWQPL